MLVSYHNHTNWSDGQSTLESILAAARQAGLDEVGISDHYVLAPNGVPIEWSMPRDFLDEYVARMRRAAAAESSLKVRLGIEADFFPETVESLREMLARHPFDYVIGSVHYSGAFPLDSSASYWNALDQDDINGKWRSYWLLVRQMAESRAFDFAAHLDLPKKYGHRPTVDYTRESRAALDAIAAADMAIEINTAGWALPAREAYPGLELLRAARERGIPLTINADAHRPDYLTRNFDRARDLAREAGYTELVRYEARQRFSIPLDDRR